MSSRANIGFDLAMVEDKSMPLEPATLDQRLRTRRNVRMASQLASASTLVAWVGGFTVLLAIVGVGLLSAH